MTNMTKVKGSLFIPGWFNHTINEAIVENRHILIPYSEQLSSLVAKLIKPDEPIPGLYIAG